MLRFLVVLVVGLLLLGCGSTVKQVTSSEFQRGVVIRDGGQLVLRPCHATTGQPLQDDSGELLHWFAQAPVAFDQAYAELMVFPDPLDPRLKHIDQVLLVGSQPRACDFELNGNHYRAAGEKPLWIADVRDEGIRVKVRGSLRQLHFPSVEPERSDTRLIWRSQLNIQDGYQMALMLSREACHDQYGTRYPYHAELTLNTLQLTGCAREGNLGLRSLVARYRYEDTALSLQLDLKADGQLILTDVRRQAEGTVASYMKGEWRVLESGRVLLEVSLPGGTKQLLFLEREGHGALRIKPGHKPYQAGVLLRRQEALPSKDMSDVINTNAPSVVQ